MVKRNLYTLFTCACTCECVLNWKWLKKAGGNCTWNTSSELHNDDGYKVITIRPSWVVDCKVSTAF